jgi:two-component system OmpR family response regulator
MKVLIVDDEPFLGELVKLALEADGHDCIAVVGLDEASELLRAVRIDLVSLDLAADGRRPLRWLEETTLAYPDLHGRAFILTDRALELDEATRLVACGARVIEKPFTLNQMREAVRTMASVTGRPPGPSPRGPSLEV